MFHKLYTQSTPYARAYSVPSLLGPSWQVHILHSHFLQKMEVVQLDPERLVVVRKVVAGRVLQQQQKKLVQTKLV